ncbi:MAG: glycosyltransferase family 39 protein [Acidimicrobiia bacterium]
MAVSGRHGFHRDELYFVVAGRNLAWGFIDQPPFTPLVARISELVGGTSPVVLRVLPALAVASVSLMAAAMASRLGGGRVAQTFAAATVGLAGVLLGEGHLLSTAVFDFALWSAALLILIVLLDGGSPKLWVALGLVIGVGLQNKHTIAFLAAAMLVAILLTPQRRILSGRWPWLGALVAGVIAFPNLMWQWDHGFPQFEMARAISSRSDGPLAFVFYQPLLLSVTLAIPAAIGLWRLARSPTLKTWRSIAIGYGLLFSVFLVTGAKAYYIAPMYPALLAAGAVWFEGLSSARRRLVAALAGAGIVIGVLIALPVTPVRYTSTLDATGEVAETVGWPALVEQVAAVYETIPEADRDRVAIFTASYGEAGAIDVLGQPAGLPAASSGHNNYWLWGPPAHHGPIVGVGRVEEALALVCPGFRQVGAISNPYGVNNEEAGLPIYLCTEPQKQLSDIWDQVRHYN